MKREIHQLKQRVDLLEIGGEPSGEPNFNKIEEIIRDQDKDEFINSIEKYIKQKWKSKTLLKIKNYVSQHTILIDSGADVNCIREGVIPSKYFVKTTYRINVANGHRLQVSYKIPEVHVCI